MENQLRLTGTSRVIQPEFWAKVLDLADDAIIAIDGKQRITLFNRGAERIFGYPASDVMGLHLEVLLPARMRGSHEFHVRTFASGSQSARSMGERSRIAGLRRDGAEFPAEASITKAEGESGQMFMVILRDITRQVETETRLRDSIHEKEVLLREIHHRVKNNLQVVQSLLGLQARAHDDPRVRAMFEESQARIHSMALLHETLYGSTDLARIDFAEYLTQLAAHLLRSYGALGRVRLRAELDKVQLNLDVAVPCGLIVNELLSNSLKYAFPNNRQGEIRIGLREPEAGLVELLVADDGIGLGSEWQTSKTLGLRLVRTLADQLGAKLEIGNTGGAEVKLTFQATD